MEPIKIELTPEDALLFRKFQEHYEAFALLFSAGVFNVKNGQATLNFDANGTLVQIKFEILSFKKGFPIMHALT